MTTGLILNCGAYGFIHELGHSVTKYINNQTGQYEYGEHNYDPESYMNVVQTAQMFTKDDYDAFVDGYGKNKHQDRYYVFKDISGENLQQTNETLNNYVKIGVQMDNFEIGGKVCNKYFFEPKYGNAMLDTRFKTVQEITSNPTLR